MKPLTSPVGFTRCLTWVGLLILGAWVQAADHERSAPPNPPQPPPVEGAPPARLERRGEPVPNRREAAEIEDRLRRMDAEIKELRRLGDNEAADRLERQRQELKQRLMMDREPREVLAPMAPAAERPGPPMEPERRRQMVREAVEILRAAGYPDIAELVVRETRAMGDRGGLDRPRNVWGRGPMEDPAIGAADRTERLERAVMDIQRVLRELDRRLRELER